MASKIIDLAAKRAVKSAAKEIVEESSEVIAKGAKQASKDIGKSRKNFKDNILNSKKIEQEFYNQRSGSGNKAFKRSTSYKNGLEDEMFEAYKNGDLEIVDSLREEINKWENNKNKRDYKIKKNREINEFDNLDSETKKILDEIGQTHGGGSNDKTGNPKSTVNKKSSNASAKNTDLKGNGNNFVYKMAAAGVGGGLVLSMSNKKGQQSNSQLYGQGGY